MKKVKTTVSFQPSPEVQTAVASGNIGSACYKAQLFINGTKGSLVQIPAGDNHFQIEAEIGSQIGMYISAFNRDGTQSPAVPFEFTVIDKVPPSRPQGLHVTRVIPVLETIAETPQPKIPQVAHDYGGAFNITVAGHEEIKDGAVGTILGVDPEKLDSVHAMFPAESLRPGVKAPNSGKEYVFSADTTLAVKIITPEQDTISLQQYIDIQLALVAN